MKAIITASVASMIDQFNMNNISILKDLGYEVHVACNFNEPGTITKERSKVLQEKLAAMGVTFFQIDFSRNVLNIFKSFKSLRQLKHLFKNNNYDLVHCHSPIGGMLTRIAAKKYRKKGLRVIYTAHGFHFYKGAPLKNWLLFYPIEKMCSRWTDLLITINREDFDFAKKKMKAKEVEYIPGVGVDVEHFKNMQVDIIEKRESLGVPINAKVLLSVGELNKNKNHQVVIKALSKFDSSNYYYVIVGKGQNKNKEYLESLAKSLNVNLVLLGYRTDIAELYKVADLFILPSIREGLNVSLIEALASGCRAIASDIRGNRDMLSASKLFAPFDVDKIASLILSLDNSEDIFYKNADVNIVNQKIKNIYSMKE